MKAKISVFLFLCMFQNMFFSQDTAIVKFLPLKVGNVWVYNWTASGGWPNNGKVSVKITGTFNANGHIYYNFEQTGTPCACAQPTYSPFLIQLNNPFRIDSITGNIFYKSTNCGWHFGEQLFDSLKLIPFNIVNNACFWIACYDTNNVTVFGNTYASKYVGMPIMTYGTFRRYAKGFGLVSSHQNGSYGSTCDYSLSGCVLNGVVYGDTTITEIFPVSQEVPTQFSLSQNYPNPFNPSTKIKFDTPPPPSPKGREQWVRLIIYDILGRETAVLVNEWLHPGTYEVEWDASNFPSGVYFYKLLTTDASAPLSIKFTETRKMVLVK